MKRDTESSAGNPNSAEIQPQYFHRNKFKRSTVITAPTEWAERRSRRAATRIPDQVRKTTAKNSRKLDKPAQNMKTREAVARIARRHDGSALCKETAVITKRIRNSTWENII